MPFDADDIAAFNDADMPAYAVATIGADGVAGRFRSAYTAAFGIDGTAPLFDAASTDVATVVRGTALTVHGTNYTVTGVEPDAVTGMTRLKLQEA